LAERKAAAACAGSVFAAEVRGGRARGRLERGFWILGREVSATAARDEVGAAGSRGFEAPVFRDAARRPGNPCACSGRARIGPGGSGVEPREAALASVQRSAASHRAQLAAPAAAAGRPGGRRPSGLRPPDSPPARRRRLPGQPFTLEPRC
jgi:hypothetical protein